MDPFFKRLGAGIIPGFIMASFLIGFVGLLQLLLPAHILAIWALLWIAWAYKFGSKSKGADHDGAKARRSSYSR